MTSELGTAIHEALETYTLPGRSEHYFAQVFKGEPEALTPTAGRALARWRVVRTQPPPEGVRNLKGDRMVVAVFSIDVYWPLTPLQGAQQAREDDVAVVLIDLPNVFIRMTGTDYNIGGYPVALLTVEDVSPVVREAPFPTSSNDMRILTIELHARVLEAS